MSGILYKNKNKNGELRNFNFAPKVFEKVSDINSNSDNEAEGGGHMRIEAYTQVQQLYNTKKVAKAESKNNVSFSDQLQISSIGKDIQTAKAAVAGSSDIREDVTAPIKASIQAGTYEVSAESFADKLLKKYEEAR